MKRTVTECFVELASVVERAQGARLTDHKDSTFVAGCLASVAVAAGIETNAIREAIAPIDLETALKEAAGE